MIGLLVLTCKVFGSRAFSFLDNPTESRVSRIDGLRFFLSFFVVCHHYVLSYRYFEGKPWNSESIADYPINTLTGPLGVAIFFMVSGYVFASVNVQSWTGFYKKRALRIVPIYMVSSLFCIAIALWVQRYNIDTTNIFGNIYFWLDAGFTGSKPDLFGMANTKLINAGVSWTLFYEWAFYFSLPLIYMLRDKMGSIPLSITVFFISFYFISTQNPFNASFISYFAIGFLSKELQNNVNISKFICNITGWVLLITIFIFARDMYSISYLPIISALFVFICLGGDFFGILEKKAFIRLGDASYSIYLLHGIAWFCMNKTIQALGIITTPFEYILVSTFTYFALLLISSATYKLIEKPFITLGKRR